MENLRYLFVAIAALTLIMSVVSGVNPSYFASLNAFAEEHEEEDDDNNSGSGESDEEESEDDEESEEEDTEEDGDNELEQSLGNHSKATLEVDDDHVDLEVEIEDGDLDDGHYGVIFACTSPDVDEEFTDALDVEDGNGDFDTEMALENGTYSGCEVIVGELSATFPSFNVMPHEDEEEDDEEHEEENDESEEDQHEEDDEDEMKGEHEEERSKSKLKTEDEGIEIEVGVQGLNMTDGSYDAVFACEEPAFNVTLDDAFEVHNGEGKLEQLIGLANGTYSGCNLIVEDMVVASFDRFTVSEETEEQEHEVEQKRKEKRERIVTTINGVTIHERHRSENASSPGEYQLGWNYTLTANGTTDHEADTAVDINMAVWKSTGAIILLDVIDGTVEVENQTYTVVLGYAFYTIHHDTLRVGALAIDDDGNIYKLKLRGNAEDDAEFPMESGSIALVFEGSSGLSINRFGDWQLTLDGTVSTG